MVQPALADVRWGSPVYARHWLADASVKDSNLNKALLVGRNAQ